MRRLAKISILVVLFGELGFSAAAHYLNLQHPSWPFWIVLYAVSGLFMLRYITRPKLTNSDLYFFVFIGYIILNFIILGESSQSEFTLRIILVCVGPYLCGRVLGKNAPISLSYGLQIVSFIYIVLVGIELVRDPGLFQLDRLYLFTREDLNRTGGEATAFNLGITLGSTWVVTLASLTYEREKQGTPAVSSSWPWLLTIILGFPAVLLFVGSRTSVLSLVLCVIIMRAYTSRKLISNNMIVWSSASIAGLAVSYNFLSEERKLLFGDIAFSVLRSDDYMDPYALCLSEGGSVFNRLAQLSQAWQLFLESPIFGIGSSNYGLRYCGVTAEFASPHSLFAHVLVEYGLIGAFLLAVMLVGILRMFLRRMRLQDSDARLAAWGLVWVWMFELIQVQSIGNLLYDYHLFVLTGLLVSCLQYGDWGAKRLETHGGTLSSYKLHQKPPISAIHGKQA